MSDTPLRPATTDEVVFALAYALRFHEGRRVRDAERMAAQLAAERLVQHLELSGYIVMKKPPSPAPDASPHMPRSAQI
jgi:hypothetical protein